MQLTSTNSFPVPDGPDLVAVALFINPQFNADGVTTSVTLQATHYRQPGGNGPPVKIGDSIVESHPVVELDAATDPILAEAVGAIAAAIQAYISAKGI